MIVAQSLLRMGYIVGRLAYNSGNPFGVLPGNLLQIVTAEGLTTANTAVVIPNDGTIPQNTEGAAYALDTTIVPQLDNSRLLIRVFIPIVSCSGAGNFVGALFRDAAVDAVCANAVTIGVVNQQYAFELFTSLPANSRSPTTFRFRFGPATAITAYILSSGAVPGFFGGLPTSFMTVMEIAGN